MNLAKVDGIRKRVSTLIMTPSLLLVLQNTKAGETELTIVLYKTSINANGNTHLERNQSLNRLIDTTMKKCLNS